MKPLNTQEVIDFVETHIADFHQRRLEGLSKINLHTMIKKKNPYLFKAKNLERAQDIVKGFLDAHLSSQEEGMFGTFLENLAIFVCSKTLGGRKSAAEGIDLEFEKQNIFYLVSIKSGPNWGNSSQVAKMRDNFKTAMQRQRANSHGQVVQSVNGCCYGKTTEKNYDQGFYWKLCGQSFWKLVSGDEELYWKIVEPLGHKAKEKNKSFYQEYDRLLNMLTKRFLDAFCESDGSINWKKIVEFNARTDTALVLDRVIK